MIRRILFSPDPPEPAPGNPEPAAPPAAKTVVTGQKTEREITLETDLETERNSHAKTAKEKKDREVRIAELEDELHKLRTPAPAPAKRKSFIPDISEFFEG